MSNSNNISRRGFLKFLGNTTIAAATLGSLGSIADASDLESVVQTKWYANDITGAGQSCGCATISNDGSVGFARIPSGVILTEGAAVDLEPDIFGWKQKYVTLTADTGTVYFFPEKGWEILVSPQENLRWFTKV